jgi:predicted HAD superfamily Cof-like phosphohydrolase
MSIFSDQGQFMTLAEQTTDGLDYSQFGRYADHVQEEAKELAGAIRNIDEDPVEVIDALVDTIVVSAGALISLIGVNGAERAWSAVLGSNFRKVLGAPNQEEGIHYREDGQIDKPPGWISPKDRLERIAQEAGLIDDGK